MSITLHQLKIVAGGLAWQSDNQTTWARFHSEQDCTYIASLLGKCGVVQREDALMTTNENGIYLHFPNSAVRQFPLEAVSRAMLGIVVGAFEQEVGNCRGYIYNNNPDAFPVAIVFESTKAFETICRELANAPDLPWAIANAAPNTILLGAEYSRVMDLQGQIIRDGVYAVGLTEMDIAPLPLPPMPASPPLLHMTAEPTRPGAKGSDSFWARQVTTGSIRDLPVGPYRSQHEAYAETLLCDVAVQERIVKDITEYAVSEGGDICILTAPRRHGKTTANTTLQSSVPGAVIGKRPMTAEQVESRMTALYEQVLHGPSPHTIILSGEIIMEATLTRNVEMLDMSVVRAIVAFHESMKEKGHDVTLVMECLIPNQEYWNGAPLAEFRKQLEGSDTVRMYAFPADKVRLGEAMWTARGLERGELTRYGYSLGFDTQGEAWKNMVDAIQKNDFSAYTQAFEACVSQGKGTIKRD